MTRKDEILNHFRNLDVSTLEKLRKYSELFIIPEEDLLVNATMSKMVQKAHSLADTLFPEWTDRSKSDFGEFLIELFALFSEKDFWYINAFANEGIFRKMKSYSNAFSKASTLGYQPKTCKSASANFEFTFDKGTATKYEVGDLVVSVGDFSFVNDTPFEVPDSLTEKTIPLTLKEGSYEVENVTYNGYNIFVQKKNIDVSSIRVNIGDIYCNRVNNFFHSGVDSYDFMVIPDEDGTCRIYFGGNGYGAQPPIGSTIIVEFRVCKGANANIESTISLLKDVDIESSLQSREATKVILLSTEIVDGENAESLTSIKEKAPNIFSVKKVAFNEKSTEELINSFPFVSKSKVLIVDNVVTYRVVPNSGARELSIKDSTTLKKAVSDSLIVGYTCIHSKNTYVPVLESGKNLYITVQVLSDCDKTFAESAIKNIIIDFSNPLSKATYGGSFEPYKILQTILANVVGVQNVEFKVGSDQQNANVLTTINTYDASIFEAIDSNNIKVTFDDV